MLNVPCIYVHGIIFDRMKLEYNFQRTYLLKLKKIAQIDNKNFGKNNPAFYKLTHLLLIFLMDFNEFF